MSKLFHLFCAAIVFGAATVCTSNFIVAQDSGEQQSAEQELVSPFAELQAKFLKVEYNGQLLYSRATVSEDVRSETITIARQIESTRLIEREVGGEKVVKAETVNAQSVNSIVVTMPFDVEYERADQPVTGDFEFLSLDGTPLERDEWIGRIGMNRISVLVIGENEEISESWKSAFASETLVLKTGDPNLAQELRRVSFGYLQNINERLSPAAETTIDALKLVALQVQPTADSELGYRLMDRVATEDSPLKTTTATRAVPYTVMVPYTEVVEGRAVTRMREVLRTRMETFSKIVGGKIVSLDMPIPTSVVFEDVNGEPLDRQQVIEQVGEQGRQILLVPRKMEIPKFWKNAFDADTVFARYREPLAGQNGLESMIQWR